MATSQHTGSGTLRGGGVKRIYGNMASLKQYKNKIDYRLPLVAIICLASIASILFLYGLYQLKGHDTLVEYVKNTRDIVRFVTDPRNKRDTAEFVEPLAAPGDDDPAEDVQKAMEDSKAEETAPMAKSEIEEVTTQIIPGIIIVENLTTTTTTTLAPTTTTTTPTTTTTIFSTTVLIVEATTTTFGPEWLTLAELDDMHDRLTNTYSTIWKLFAVNIVAFLILLPATVIFHLDYFGINRYKTIFRVIMFLVLLFFFIQLIYLISPILTSTFRFPEMIDRLFAPETKPKHERGIEEIKETFACDFETHPELIARGFQDPCVPKIKDSLFPAYSTVFLILLDILPFIFALFTYAWDAWVKDCTQVREARMRVELNNQRRPQTREEILRGAIDQQHWSSNNSADHFV
jgi:hypothetical protein